MKENKGIHLKFTFNDMMMMGLNTLKSGFGLVQSLEKMVDAKIKVMLEAGELNSADAKKIKKDLKNTLHNAMAGFTGKINNGVRSTLNHLNIATLQDLKILETRLDKIIAKVDTVLTASKKAPSKRKKKATPRKKPVKRAVKPSSTAKKS